MELQFNPEAKSIFCKPRWVLFDIQSDLTQALDAGKKKGIWTPVQVNDWITPIVSVRKRGQNNAFGAHLRVCGDYSATVNPQQLKSHRHPLLRPKELIQRLGADLDLQKLIWPMLTTKFD